MVNLFSEKRLERIFILGLVVLLVALTGCEALDSAASADYQSAPPLPTSEPFVGVANSNQPAPTVPLANTQSLAPTGNLETDIHNVASKVRPAVVFIGIEQNVRSFSQPVPVGNGSGAIIDQQGHILTNNHVIEGARLLKVTLPDGRTFPAQVVGRDPATDLAVIRIQASNLPTLSLGDSNNLRIGDWVVAIGNALGLEGGPTVTTGVISALNRTISEENGASLYGLIQTDAAINPGNSGGPLVNLSGEIIGINTAVPGPTGQGYQPYGIGFAISINEAKPIIQQLMTQGRVTRPYLGVGTLTLTPAIASQAGIDMQRGVVITDVAAGSPAARARLQQGDIIIAVDGKVIANDAELRQAIQAHKIGDTIQVTILREGRQLTATAQLAQAPTP
ncbi:MAG: trypsin-like peptidase domain-containing protein [Chloroflexi bacterium]|nr:trypsin-like peptidase domain-containing protein [Chloroflexota bacterium]